MGFLAVDSLLAAIVAAGVVMLVVVGNEIYLRRLRKRYDLQETREARHN